MEDATRVFEAAQTFPDPDAARRLAALVGIDDSKDKLVKILACLVHFDAVQKWATKNYGSGATPILQFVQRMPPLVILAGDVGTGKTELAETVGDAVARQEGISITLLPLSLASRGSGRVGEMTQLISGAFTETSSLAKKLKRSDGKKASGAVILMIDEADALVQSREAQQMHHEDRAGVNGIIRGIDAIARQQLPAAVIMCTNRLNAIDPAVRRRAAEVFRFHRPDEAQRLSVLKGPLSAIGFSEPEIARIVSATGPRGDQSPSFTYSDITQRLLPSLVLDAYPSAPITFERALEVTNKTHPTAPFREDIL